MEAAMRIGLFVASTFVAAQLSALPAAAQTVCLPRVEILKTLGQQFDVAAGQIIPERRVAVGISDGNHVVFELFLADNGNFTLIATHPNGLGCLLGSGFDWHATPWLGDGS